MFEVGAEVALPPNVAGFVHLHVAARNRCAVGKSSAQLFQPVAGHDAFVRIGAVVVAAQRALAPDIRRIVAALTLDPHFKTALVLICLTFEHAVQHGRLPSKIHIFLRSVTAQLGRFGAVGLLSKNGAKPGGFVIVERSQIAFHRCIRLERLFGALDLVGRTEGTFKGPALESGASPR